MGTASASLGSQRFSASICMAAQLLRQRKLDSTCGAQTDHGCVDHKGIQCGRPATLRRGPGLLASQRCTVFLEESGWAHLWEVRADGPGPPPAAGVTDVEHAQTRLSFAYFGCRRAWMPPGTSCWCGSGRWRSTRQSRVQSSLATRTAPLRLTVRLSLNTVSFFCVACRMHATKTACIPASALGCIPVSGQRERGELRSPLTGGWMSWF